MDDIWRCPECSTPIPEKNRRGPHLSACRRSLKKGYIYKDGNKHPHEWITCKRTECGKRALVKAHGKGFCSKACAQNSENNSTWKGADAAYVAKHARVYRLRGPAISCVWGCDHTRYEWANLTGNYDDLWDYAQMCSACHHRFDGAIAKCMPMMCKAGLHDMSLKENYYSKIRNGKEVRQCAPCARARARKARDKNESSGG